MKQYVKMVIFILALGAISAGLLIGVDLLTASRIEKNKMFELYGSILDANNVEYNQTNFDEVFNSNFDVMVALDSAVNAKPAYQHKETRNISFEFQGNGMWGPIRGVMTLKEDAVTIVAVRILEQEETPGLGARIVEEEFLDRFVDKQFPNLNIIKDRVPTSDHEILGLTGATSTTGKLQGILNSEFMKFYRNYVGDDLDQGAELEKFIKLLAEHGVELGERNLNEVLNETFEIVEDNDLSLYINNELGLVSYITNADIKFSLNGAETENITIITTLESDKETVRSIVGVYESADGHWGKVQFLDVLDAKGAKFPDVIIQPGAGSGNIDGGSGVTFTRTDFQDAINSAYDSYKPLLDTVTVEGGDFRPVFIITEEDIQKAILNALDLTGRNFEEVMVKVGDNLYVELDTLKTVYVVKTKMHFGYDEEVLENIVVIVVLEEDKATINNVSAIFENNIDHEAKLDLLSKEALSALKEKVLPGVTIDIPGANYYPKATLDLDRAINQGYNRNLTSIGKIDYDALAKLKFQKAVLKGQGYDVDSILINDFIKVFERDITIVENADDILYINKVNNKVTMGFVDDIRFGRLLDDIEATQFYVTLAADLETILDVLAMHDSNSKHWGKVKLLTEEVLSKLRGVKYPNLDFKTVIGDKDAFLGITGVTGTGEDFTRALNEAYNRNINKIKEQFTIKTVDGKTYLTNNETEVVTYYYEAEISFARNGAVKETVLIYVTKEEDFNKLTDISVLHDENSRHWGKRDLFIASVLSKVKGRTIEELFKDLDGKHQFDDVTGVTYTTEDFRKVLLEQDASFEKAYEGGTK